MSLTAAVPSRAPHWSGSLAFRLGLLCAILVVPLTWLGIQQYVEIHRQIATTREEQRGIDLVAMSVGVLQLSARVEPDSPRAPRAAVGEALAALERAAAGVPEVPVIARRAHELRAQWARIEQSRSASDFASFGNALLDSIGDIADGTRIAFESQVETGDIGDALDNTYALRFERLIAAYRTAAGTRPGYPADVMARIAMAGYLARSEATDAPLDIDMRGALREDPTLRAWLEKPYRDALGATNGLRAPLVAIVRGEPVTSESLAALARRHAALVEASAVYFDTLHGTLSDLLDVRLERLDREDRILTSVLFAGIAVLIGVTILIVRAVGRRHRNELLSAQQDAERLSAELARQRAERALLLTEAQFRAVFERSQMGIAMLARDGSTIESNGALKTLVGDDTNSLIPANDPDFRALVEGRRGTYQSEKPLKRPNGATVWVEITLSPVSVPQPEETAAIAIVQDITERKAVDERLRYAASHDELTALPNRTEFVREVSAALSDRENCDRSAVLFIDLDGFKLINDGLGHHAGDRVLAASARRLRAACRPGDIVARFHGDEFAILLRNISGETAVRAAAERVQSELRTPISVGGSVAMVTSSVGIVTLHPGYVDAEQVLRNADAAMYHAKARGRSHTALFDDSMYQKVASHFRLSSDLRNALDRGQIQLAYQPIVSLIDGSVVGLEGLLRWEHPLYGSISPVDFIPVAEESDVILELGRFALEKAGTLLADIDRTHPDIELRSISVNLSVAQLAQGDVVGDVRRTLQHNGLEGKRLLLEVTETAIMDNGPQAVAIFASLRELGVRLCIDDFGTGYSSLRYLNEFPFDVLKIDRSFVRGTNGRLANEPIVTMLMRLAESLKVTVIAEGIETEEQRIKLRDGGCRFGQGFLFAQALSETEIVPWLEAAAQHKTRRSRLRIAP